MKIYLIDINVEIIKAWEKYFSNEKDVEIVYMSLEEFVAMNDVECIVSPANSFGLMDGGYDAAITALFGDALQKKVQKYILEHYYGEQPVGTSFIIDIPGTNIKLIHTPSMRIPERITDSLVVYTCMRTCLMSAKDHGVESLLVPAFGGCTGRVDSDELAKMMYLAYKQIEKEKKIISWEEAIKTHIRKA